MTGILFKNDRDPIRNNRDSLWKCTIYCNISIFDCKWIVFANQQQQNKRKSVSAAIDRVLRNRFLLYWKNVYHNNEKLLQINMDMKRRCYHVIHADDEIMGFRN